MALTEKTIPYEVLIRFGPDGLIQGMHSATRTLVMRDGVVISDTPNAPVTVTAGQHVGIDLDGVMTQAQQALIASLEAKTAEAADLASTVQTLQQEFAAAQKQTGEAGGV